MPWPDGILYRDHRLTIDCRYFITVQIILANIYCILPTVGCDGVNDSPELRALLIAIDSNVLLDLLPAPTRSLRTISMYTYLPILFTYYRIICDSGRL